MTLRCRLGEYLALRRALGFRLVEAEALLTGFVTFLEQRGATVITTSLAVEWATQPRHTQPGWWAYRLSAARLFAEHVRGVDPRTEVPARDLLPRRVQRVAPYLYSDGDIERLIRAARLLPYPLMARTYATLMGLLAVTGMRVGETIRLDRDDIDWKHGILTIHGSKFGKSRQIPLHGTTVDALAEYDRDRDRLGPRPRVPSFFLSLRGTRGTRLIYKNVQHVFHRLVLQAGIGRTDHRGPRIHDLRHTFAVRTLLGWHRTRGDVARSMPLLSTYLGHGDPVSTYWYLSSTPQLLAVAAQRLERQPRRAP
jgi:integrase